MGTDWAAVLAGLLFFIVAAVIALAVAYYGWLLLLAGITSITRAFRRGLDQ